MIESDQDVRDYLKKVMQTLFAGLFWLILNMTVGIFFGFLFITKKLSVGNVLFYCMFIVSLFILLRFCYSRWKN